LEGLANVAGGAEEEDHGGKAESGN
jgi:hypothetical protein